MEILFRSKEESNKTKEENFLKLSPTERVLAFFELQYFFKDFPTNAKTENNNFIIIIQSAEQELE